MNPEEIKNLIHQVLDERQRDFVLPERYTFQKHAQFFNGRNLQFGIGVGSQLGTESTQKIGMYGVSPTAQQSKINDPSGQANDLDSECRAKVIEIIDALETLGITST